MDGEDKYKTKLPRYPGRNIRSCEREETVVAVPVVVEMVQVEVALRVVLVENRDVGVTVDLGRNYSVENYLSHHPLKTAMRFSQDCILFVIFLSHCKLHQLLSGFLPNPVFSLGNHSLQKSDIGNADKLPKAMTLDFSFVILSIHN